MKILLHAPTTTSLARARESAVSFARHNPDDTVRIVADGEGAVAAHDAPSVETDHLLIVCRASLQARGLEPPTGVELTPSAVELVGRLQRKGWSYVRS